MPIKILMFGWEFPPHNSGGLGVACLGLAKALLRVDVDLTFVLPNWLDLPSPPVKVIFANRDKIRFRQVDSLLYPYLTSQTYLQTRLQRSQNGIYGPSLLDEVNRYAELARDIAREEDFDVIHAHDWLSFLAGVAAKEVSHKPLVVQVHATEFDRSGNNINREVYGIEKFGMEQADSVIAVSQFTKDLIVSRYGIDPGKIAVVHNGIDSAEYAGFKERDVLSLKPLKQSGNKIVLFVGRITMQKGPEYFLRAAKKVLEFMPDVYFIMAGLGDMQRQVIQESALLGISDRVIFAGFLRGEELQTVYQAADLFVLPSVSEPFGIAPLESVVNGTPVLISKQSGVSEVLTHALRADFWDIDDMTDKILSALRNPSLIRTLSENGQQEVKKLSWLEAARKCREIYRCLLNLRKGPGSF